MSGVPATAKRFSALPPMASEEINHVQEPDKVSGKTYYYSDKWVLGVDSICRTTEDPKVANPLDGEDEGTVYLPMSRIAMRDTNGLVPASMLPSYIDDMLFGSLSVDSTEGKSTFTDSETGNVYVSPENKRSGTELEPLANVIYIDTTSSLQYRYIKSQETEVSVNYGFAEVPGSRAIAGGYGIELATTQGTNELTISAKTPDFVKIKSASSETTVTNQAAVIPLPSSTYIESDTVTVGTQGSTTQLGGLDSDIKYMFNMRLGVVPTALSGNIIDVTFTLTNGSNVSTIVKTVDMSGPAGTKTVLDYSFMLCPTSTSVTMSLEAEESVKVTTEDFSLVELI